MDVNGYHWSLRAMVLHVGPTREQGHFIAHILARDVWWLCDDASVTKGRPPATSRKVTFVLYERTPTEMVGLSQGGSQSNRSVRDAPSECAATTVDRHVRSMPSKVGDVQPTTEFFEAVAKLVRKQRVRVKQHLQVRV